MRIARNSSSALKYGKANEEEREEGMRGKVYKAGRHGNAGIRL